MELKLIASDDLHADDVPDDTASWNEIGKFALTFDGYKALGFEGVAKLANSRSYRTLDEARGCLFFEQRRWRHFGDHPDDDAMSYIRTLVSAIRQKVGERDLDGQG